MSGSSTQNTFRSVRLAEPLIAELLDRLDAAATSDGAAGQRFRYRIHNCVVNLQQPGAGTPVAYLCSTRCLSDHELWFLHGGYVHAGSRCVIQLISAHGAWENVPARVAACTYVQGAIHEVRAKFDRAIDPGTYCPDAVKVSVLMVDDDPSLLRLVDKFLDKLNAEVVHAADGHEAVEKAMVGSFDIVFMDVEMPGLNGLDATRELRKRGYTGLIVAATARTRPEDQQACIDAGCDRFIGKPYNRKDFEAVFAAARQEPLFSSMADDATMLDLINEFVADLPARIKALEAAFDAARLDELEGLARAMKGSSGGFGFDPICKAAEKLERSLQQALPDVQIRTDLTELINFAHLARPSARQG